jgi:hypothetical protein
VSSRLPPSRKDSLPPQISAGSGADAAVIARITTRAASRSLGRGPLTKRRMVARDLVGAWSRRARYGDDDELDLHGLQRVHPSVAGGRSGPTPTVTRRPVNSGLPLIANADQRPLMRPPEAHAQARVRRGHGSQDLRPLYDHNMTENDPPSPTVANAYCLIWQGFFTLVNIAQLC